jgi:hypothetical protein
MAIICISVRQVIIMGEPINVGSQATLAIRLLLIITPIAVLQEPLIRMVTATLALVVMLRYWGLVSKMIIPLLIIREKQCFSVMMVSS